jgi:hypothetical protein
MLANGGRSSTSARNREALSDLVLDSRLEVAIFADHTVQTEYRSARLDDKVEETWTRTKELGSGSYGVVWLEKCMSGPNSGDLRAVKQIRKSEAGLSHNNYHRELEAIAKFSQRRVRPLCCLLVPI